MERLKHWIKELRGALNALIDVLDGAASYTISVGVPLGVSVAITFNR